MAYWHWIRLFLSRDIITPSTSKAAKTEKLKETPKRAAKNIKSYDFNETESNQSDKDDTDDEEFVLKKEEDNEEASSELSESERFLF